MIAVTPHDVSLGLRFVSAGFLGSLLLAYERAESSTLDGIVVHGSRLPHLSVFPDADLMVLEKDDIQRRHAIDLVELLRMLPGVSMARQGGPGGPSSLYVRGAEPNFTSVYINGVQVNNPMDTRGGAFEFGHLDVFLVDKVELIKGPRSAIHGSDALAGAMNLRTAHVTEHTQSTLLSSMGGRGQRGLGYLFSSPFRDQGNGSIAYANRNYGELVTGYTLETETVTASLQNTGSRAAWSFDVVHLDFFGTSYPEDSGGPRFAILDALERKDGDELVLAGSLRTELSQRWSTEIRAGWYDRWDDTTSPGIALSPVPPNGQTADFRRRSVTWINEFRWPSGPEVVAGLDFSDERGSAEGYLEFPESPLATSFRLNRANYSSFLEVRRASSQWAIMGSVRLDSPDGFDSRSSLRVGAIYRTVATGTRFSADWAQGFKVPSLFALGNNLVGNPDLEPETSHGISLSITQPLPWSSIRIALFRTWYQDLIDFDFESFRNVNRSRVRTSGAELEVDWFPAEILQFNVFGTYLSTEIDGNPGRLRGRPKAEAGASMTWAPQPSTSLMLTAHWTGEALQSSLVTGLVPLNPYWVVNLNCTWQVSPKLKLDLAIDNTLNQGFEEAVGVPSPGRQFRIQATYSLRHRFSG